MRQSNAMRVKDDDGREDRLRRDPRRDATVPPPAEADDDAPPSSRRGAESGMAADYVPPSARRSVEVLPAARVPDAAREPPREADATRDSQASVVTSQDPRLAELEPLITTADWEGVVKKLGPPEQAGRLPPNLGLLYAVASKELAPPEAQPKGTSGASSEAGINEIAIRCAAGLLGVGADSPIALMLAKRLLRRNPVGWQKRPAPSTPVSLLIVALGLVIGAGIGWLVSFGYVSFRLP